jgi:tripartite-type tricarboxylate transporter receptor subunit TctC
MLMLDRRRLLAAPAMLGLAGTASAQGTQGGAWPNRPVRVVIPWPPGQATDLAARITAERLGTALGQPFVAENRAGAGGMIGTDLVAKAAPDGHTLLAASTGPIVTSPLVQRTTYNAERDFAEVAITGVSPYLLVVPPAFPARTAEEFVAMVRARPGHFTFSSSGTGATAHVVAAWFHALARLDVVHVPFAGSGPAITALVGGHVSFSIETLAATGPLIRNGQLRALGISFANGSQLAPEVPPLAQLAGLEGYDAGAWIGIMAPAGTPAPILERLDTEITRAMGEREFRERIAGAGLEPIHHNREGMRRYIAAQRRGFQTAIQAANIRIDS